MANKYIKEVDMDEDDIDFEDNIEAIAKEIVKRLKEQTTKPCVCFQVKRKKANILDSKIGGSFYVPEGLEKPINTKTGKDLYFLAQLNFAEIPHLENFPETGLLQFFVDGYDQIFGMNFDDDSCFRLLPKLTKQALTINDYRLVESLKTHCKDLLPDDFENIYDLDSDIFDYLYIKLETYLCQIGGYPFFTQVDPREENEKLQHLDTLLFMLDTVEDLDIMWGDGGVGYYFINSEDLKNKDFSRVKFGWDCF